MAVDLAVLTAYCDRKTGQCSLCQRMVEVIAGRLQTHDNPLSRLSCPGSGQPPADEVLTRRQRANLRRFIS